MAKGQRKRGAGKRKRVGKARVLPNNFATMVENYVIQVNDGVLTFNNNIQLADVIYDRAQAVAQAYQEFKIKYVRLAFRPSADTFPIAAGNAIPQMYFMLDRAGSIPSSATLNTLLDMGCKPTRFDDKNIIKKYVPTVLVADKTAAGVVSATQVRSSPWLSTNYNAGNPSPAWSPSQTDHLGCCFLVTKPNPLTPTIQYNVDVEVLFHFRKPLWRGAQPGEETAQHILNGQLAPLHTV